MRLKISSADDSVNYRYSGILVHPTSFPSPYGIGDFGKGAYDFIDFLEASGQHLWQILPLNPITSYGNSPYQGFSVFAGEPLLLSPQLLKEQGLLAEEDLRVIPDFDPVRVDYEAVRAYKYPLYRKAYQNFLEGGGTAVTEDVLRQCISTKSLLYDKNGEEHYNIISALHKSMRNSDPDAAVYWLARMLEAGEDPLYVARRVVRFASEDVGLADSRALEVAVAAYQACHFIGMPECSVNLAHAVVYMSMAPKSNAMEVAYNRAKDDALNTLSEPVPLVIRNAPTRLMKDLKYGEGYVYAHNTKEKMAAMQCLPDSLKDRVYYEPTEQGLEAKYKERLASIKDWKRRHQKQEK